MNLPKTNFTVGWTQTFDPHCTYIHTFGLELLSVIKIALAFCLSHANVPV